MTKNKYTRLAKLAETIKNAAADGKFTFWEIVGITFAAFKTKEELALLKHEMSQISKGELPDVFGDDAEAAPRVVRHLMGAHAHLSQLADIYKEVKVPAKKKKTEGKERAHE